LLDTHALIWWVEDHPKLSRKAEAAIGEGQVFVSAISAMEICTKYRIGKLPSAALLADRFEQEVLMEGFDILSLTAAHARMAGNFPDPHKDPFDRMLIAQALLEELVLVSNEALFDRFGVVRLW
jgi:PIN domain nuclease of toxin-antitoxin system